MYVEPGRQINLVHRLAGEAVRHVKKHDVVTIPRIAEECWRIVMMSPQRQTANHFFLGGESIIVSYPTDTMTHEDMLMSMRGNSRPFLRSTVFHELIPGHHSQYFVPQRHLARAFGILFCHADQAQQRYAQSAIRRFQRLVIDTIDLRLNICVSVSLAIRYDRRLNDVLTLPPSAKNIPLTRYSARRSRT